MGISSVILFWYSVSQVREGVEKQGKVSFEGKTHLPSIFYMGSLVLYVVLGQLSTWAVVVLGQLSYPGSCLTWAVVYLGSCCLGSCLPGQLSPGQLSVHPLGELDDLERGNNIYINISIV